ncbi:MAG: hypothetical protein IKY74_07430 [Alistipes sp.]|nr:hypothetical protein [Alistipes sp.]
MRRIVLLFVAMGVAISLVATVLNLWQDNCRLRNNQHALQQGITLYRTKANNYAASVEALSLELDEFRLLHASDTKTIRELKIRLRNVESVAQSVTSTTLRYTLILRDTIILEQPLLHASATDPHNAISATLSSDTLTLSVRSIDTLHQIIHRVPRRFWFFRYGTKAIRQEVWSSNPNTQLIYTEYIELPRRKRGQFR